MMAHGKVSLPQDLLPSPMADSLFSAKDEAVEGNSEGKALTGSLDESKDQVASESSIPLSPQWLHAKSVEAKPLASGTSGEMHAPGSLSHGNSSDSNSRDIWRSDGPRERKDWRRNAPDLDVNRRWREEERETGLLGRRDRKKEDRRVGVTSARDITENRAEDHRAGGTSTKDVSENKVLSSDRWHESRRDSKWSSRWGPEDKDKESRIEKTDVEREDAHVDKQSLVSGNRAIPERDGDSRDKWRPRHRMEVQSGGPSPYRAAPGFGMARGQVEKVGFASGRGRSSTNIQIGRPSSVSSIGSVVDHNHSVLGKAGTFTEKYRYPRGKLLDIYRKQKIESTFNILPDGMEDVSPITQVGSIEPLAFVAPAAEEEAAMEDIWKGKISSSEVSCSSSRDKTVLKDDAKGISNATLRKEEQNISANTEEKAPSTNNSFSVTGADVSTICGPQTHVLNERVDTEGEQRVLIPIVTAVADELTLVAPKNYDCKSAGEIDGPSNDVVELKISGCPDVRGFGLPKHPMLENFEPAAVAIGSQLPDDSSLLFHIPSLQKTLSSDHYAKSNEKAEVSERVVAPEDLSMCYLDPQGNIQGPFLGIDIISWFDQGFFGTDLLVRLADAPDGSPFQELGEVMPNLKTKSGLVSNPNLPTNVESLGGVGSSLEERKTAPNFEESNVLNIQHWTSSGYEATSSGDLHSRIPNNGYNSELQYLDNQRFQNFVDQDEEIVFPGRPKSSSDFPLRRPSADIQGSFPNSPSLPSLANEVSESNLPNRLDDKLHPFGLLMSELRGSSHLRPSQASNVSLGMDDQAQFRDNWLNNPNIPMHQLVPDMEHLIELQRQEQQQRLLELQQQRQLEFQRQQQHELEFQRQQQRQLELQQQRQLELQQQRQLELQQQRQLELQQQRQLELQQQRQLELQLQRQLELQHQHQLELQHQQQHHLDLQQQQQRKLELQHLQRQQQQRQLEFQQQQQRQLEIQQQQRQLELQQQQRQLELQQQQRHLELQHQLELQPQHHLQQHLRHHQMKLQQQQQSQAEQLLLEQLLNQQMSDSYGQRKMDATRANLHDQLHSSNHLPNDLHHVSHSSRHDPSLEQIIQATMGEGALQGQTDFFDLISQAKQGNRNASEPPLCLNEQELQAQHLSLALREQRQMEVEAPTGGPRFADEAGPFVRDSAGHHQAHMLGFNSSETYQHQQRFSSNDQQLSHHNWNHTSQERPQGGFYEPNSTEFDRFSVPAGSHGMNLDIPNTRGQGLDVWEQYRLSSSIDEPGSLSSGIPSHRRLVSDEFYSSHPLAFENLPCGNNGQLESSCTEAVMPYLHLNAEQKRRDTTQSSEVDYPHHLSSSRSRGGSIHLPFNLLPDPSVGMNNSLTEVPQNSNFSVLLQDHLGSYGMNEQPSNLARKSDSRAFMDAQFLSGTRDAPHEGNIAEQQESGELPSNAHSRHSSLSSAGGCGGLHSSEMGLDKSLGDDVSDGRLPSTINKGFDSATPRRRVLSSQDILSEAALSLPVKPRSSVSIRTSEGNPTATLFSESQASGKNDAQFRRTSSYSDAGVSETSFIDVLKKPVIPEADVANKGAMELSDGGGQVGRTGKKKGKKGRQIDPALLGFKVSSNRIMMGEIHRADD